MIEGLLIGLGAAFSLQNLLMVIAGCLIGTFIGMLPGLGPMSIIAIMIPVAITIGDPSAALILLAGLGLTILRDDFGFGWMAWLALVVIATDIAGYFVGRAVGGPKLWPRISPSKTWSGGIGGWVAAALVGLWFVIQGASGPELIAISVAVSMASQMGDVAESALKRRMGVKDASAILPGHGGMFDRFDGMLGASVFLLLVEQIIDFPPAQVPL